MTRGCVRRLWTPEPLPFWPSHLTAKNFWRRFGSLFSRHKAGRGFSTSTGLNLTRLNSELWDPRTLSPSSAVACTCFLSLPRRLRQIKQPSSPGSLLTRLRLSSASRSKATSTSASVLTLGSSACMIGFRPVRCRHTRSRAFRIPREFLLERKSPVAIAAETNAGDYPAKYAIPFPRSSLSGIGLRSYMQILYRH